MTLKNITIEDVRSKQVLVYLTIIDGDAETKKIIDDTYQYLSVEEQHEFLLALHRLNLKGDDLWKYFRQFKDSDTETYCRRIIDAVMNPTK